MKRSSHVTLSLALFFATLFHASAVSAQNALPPRQRAELAFVADQSANTVSAYSIRQGGGLSPLAGSPFKAGASPNSVAVVPSGRFVYVANVIPGGITAFSVSEYGKLTPISGSPFSAPTGTAFVIVDPSGRFLYALNCGSLCSASGSGDISGFNIDQRTGALSPMVGSPFTAGKSPYSLAIDPTGHFAYVANLGSGDVYSYAIDSQTGALTAVGLPVTSGEGAISVAVDPWGQLVYVANTGSNDVSAFVINFDGSLTAVIGSPFAAGALVSGITIARSGRFALVSAGAGVYVYGIDNAGALHLLTGSPVAAGTGPNGISIDPNDKFVYVVNAGSANVSAFAFNNQTGKLTQIPNSPFPAGTFAAGITTSPTPAHE